MSVTRVSLGLFVWVLAGVLASALLSTPCAAQAPAEQSPAEQAAAQQAPHAWFMANAELLKTTEAFVRKLFAWGPDVSVKLGELKQSLAADFYVVPLVVTVNGQSESGEVYVSKDGKTLLRGEIFPISSDPYADNRAKIHLEGSPSKGPADAAVTLVEYADFECPHCAELYENLKGIEARYPQMRVIYKNFPLTNIHPWAETAAIGARCAYEQSPAAFWKVHDAIFENQDLISPEDVWQKLVDFAGQAGLNPDTFKACLSSDEAKKAVDADHAEGVDLGVNSTPTVYVDGRPLPGGEPNTLTQYIDYEFSAHRK
jgi:protein-disulfide isomerase